MGKKNKKAILSVINYLRKEQISDSKNIINGKAYLGVVPKIRKNTVREIKEKIEKGNYVIDGEKVAEKIIVDSLMEDILEKEDTLSKQTRPKG